MDFETPTTPELRQVQPRSKWIIRILILLQVGLLSRQRSPPLVF